MSKFPIINLNGIDDLALLQQQHDVAEALEVLRRAMAEASPHGRDFQINQPGDLYDAQMAGREAWDHFNEIEKHYRAIYENLILQHHEKLARRAKS